MKLELAQKTVEILNDQGIEATVYEDYSGRGMFGKTTAGIVTEESGVKVGFAAAQAIMADPVSFGSNDDYEGKVDAVENFNMRELPGNWDSIGLSKIYY